MAQKHFIDTADAKRLVDGTTEVRGVALSVDEARTLLDGIEGPDCLIDELDAAQGDVHGQSGKISYLVLKITG